MASAYGKNNVSLAAALNTVEKVGGNTGLPPWYECVKLNVFNTFE